MKWFRLHHSVLDSLKVRLLQPSAQLDYFWLLCLASEFRERNGTGTADDPDMGTGETGLTLAACAWRARSETMVANGNALLDAGLIAISAEDGRVRLCDWDKYQRSRDDNRERQRQYRVRKKAETDALRNALHNASVTRGVTRDDKKKKKEKEKEKEKITVVPTREGVQGECVTAVPAEAGRATAQRGTRLSPDWRLPDEWRDWAVKVHHIEPQRAVRISLVFRDFWVAKPGKDGCKADWLATWRNWVRKETGDA